MRKKVIAGNWKMNMLPNEAIEMINELTPLVKDTDNEVVLCVPYIDLFYSLLHVQGTNIKIGAQNMHFEPKGAYTGEISGKMLKSIGVEYVIIGHSERRAYYAETDEAVNKKLKAAFEYDLKPIVCVGESLEQREDGTYFDVVEKEVRGSLDGIDKEMIASKVVVAYEPIWAIGTGKTATAEQANEMCKYIRDVVAKMYDEDTASKVRIQYGGSVKPSNANEILNMSDIDGALVGGASLTNDFTAIVNY